MSASFQAYQQFHPFQAGALIVKHLFQVVDRIRTSLTTAIAMVNMASPRALGALLVAMAILVLLAGSAQAACPPQFPLNCAAYVVDAGQSVASKLCCIEVQDNFNLKTPASTLQPWCQAVKGVMLYTGQGLTGTELQLALNLPEKCGLSSQYKKGQTCAGKLMSGGS